MMSTGVHMNTDVFHFCVWLDAVTHSNKFATAHYKLKCSALDWNLEFRIALPILYLSFLVDRIPQWSLQFLKLVKLCCYEPLQYFVVSLIMIYYLSLIFIYSFMFWLFNCYRFAWSLEFIWNLVCRGERQNPKEQSFKMDMESARKWLVEHKLRAVGMCMLKEILWLILRFMMGVLFYDVWAN